MAAQGRRRSVQSLGFTLGLLLLGLLSRGAATKNESVRLLANTTWRALGNRRLSDGYKELAKLKDTSAPVGQIAAGFRNFGYAVAISETHLAVGARFDDAAAPTGGAVYLYRRE